MEASDAEHTPTENVSSAPRAGDVYGRFIVDQIADEDKRKSSIEQRGMATITSSGALVGLLFGLSAFVTKMPEFRYRSNAALLVTALLLFVASAVSGIIANWPFRYGKVADSELTKLTIPEVWNSSAGHGERRIAAAQISILATARKSNNKKAKALAAAMVAQVSAVCCIAAYVAMNFA